MFLNLEMYVMVIVFFLIQNYMFLSEEYNGMYKMSDVNYWMSLLVLILYLMMLMVECNYKFSLNLMFVSLYVMLLMNNFLSFYLLYEMIFVLIMFTILVLGYSFERLLAAFLMLFYSFMFSSPVLMMLLILNSSFLMKEWLWYNEILLYFVMGSFMVKFPVFGFHYWLPVAHVEASTIGSMILAGILLKVGCLGLFYVVSYMKFLVKCHWMSISVVLLMLMILSMSDLKMMIAYSSVAHMSMVFYVFMTGYNIGSKGAILMMFYHGFVSPLMFWVVGILGWWKTRSLIVIKMLSFSYLFILCLFFLFILNMGFPPFMGFLSEILMLKVFVLNKMVLFVLIMSVLMSCYYNVYLFWCFSGNMGMVFKMSFFNLDLFMFLGLSFILNLY